MGLVQPILWISMYYIRFMNCFFFRSPYACSCSVSSLVLLGASLGIDGGGVSQSMNLIWHNSIKMQVHRIFTPFFFFPPCSSKQLIRGTRLKVVSTSLSMKRRISTARCEVSKRSFTFFPVIYLSSKILLALGQ